MTQFGWNCVHYSIPGSEVTCESVNCLPVKSDISAVNVTEYNNRAAKEIALRKKPGDIVICMYGTENKIAAEANSDLKTVEPGIGYTMTAAFAMYKVFTSYAQMHMHYGWKGNEQNPNWFDAVIPNGITASEFDYTEEKGDYFLYFGRVIPSKGVDIAIQATEKTGNKLIIAGAGSLSDLGYNTIPNHVTVVGPCDVEQRRKLMSKARALLGPTYYVEPFGNMVVEGYMSGTPAITTDWGGFTETVIQGVTGYRCREFREFVSAINNIDRINPRICREWALANCEDFVVHEKLNDYLKRVQQSNFYRP